MAGLFDDLIPTAGRFDDLVPKGGKAKAVADARKRIKSTPDQVRAITKGATLGFADELDAAGAALETGANNFVRMMTGRPDVGYGMRDAYGAVMQANREADQKFAEEHPVQNVALQMTGGIASPVARLGTGYVAGARSTPQAVVRAAQVGGATGAVAGAGGGEGLEGRARGALLGGAVGAGTGAALQGASAGLRARGARVAARPPSPQRQLANEGVTLTPGQMMGGGARRVEDAATSLPILGDAIREARVRGIESFDRAALNRALAPIGTALPEDAAMGRDALGQAERAISDAYDAALAGAQVVPDQQYAQDLAAVAATPNLTAAQRETLGSIIGDIQGRFGQPLAGDMWKVIDSDINKAIRASQNASATQPGGNILTGALERLKAAHVDALARSAPNAVPAVQAADEATANLVRIRNASQSAGTAARGGVFLPADLNRAVRAGDSTAGNRSYARGDALMQDLTDPAMQVLPSTVPDSGTAIRSLMTLGGLSGGGVAVGADPAIVGAAAGGLMTGAGVYSRPVQDLLNRVYRASTPGQAEAALAELGRLAAQTPALAPVYEAAARQLAGRLPSGGDPQGTRPQPQVSMTR